LVDEIQDGLEFKILHYRIAQWKVEELNSFAEYHCEEPLRGPEKIVPSEMAGVVRQMPPSLLVAITLNFRRGDHKHIAQFSGEIEFAFAATGDAVKPCPPPPMRSS
jgi:hypothetical protein